MIRHDTAVSTPGPNVPRHWYDGGNGWVTKYFYDSVPRDMKTQEHGKFRCQVLLKDGKRCDHEISEGESCKGNCCWAPRMTAFPQMSEHVRTVHGAPPPPRRQWSSNLFALDGLVEAFFCSPCLGSRQFKAVAGWEDTFHCGWCFFFSLDFGRGYYPALLTHFISTTSMNTAALLCWCRDGVLRALWPRRSVNFPLQVSGLGRAVGVECDHPTTVSWLHRGHVQDKRR